MATSRAPGIPMWRADGRRSHSHFHLLFAEVYTMLARWDPFNEMVSLREAMSDLVNQSMVRPTSRWQAGGTLPFDLYESPDHVVLRAAIPGADPNTIEVTVNQGTLRLQGYCNFYTGDQEKQYTWHARGLSEGQFQLTVSLPTHVDADGAEASYDAGVLTISLPKSEAVKPRRIAVRGRAESPAQTAIPAKASSKS